jgi:drug/metabolite transporter (DMT)-like permease
VFFLVLGAACTHALWNFFTKKVSGNFTVLWYGMLLANLAALPYSLYLLCSAGLDLRGLVPAAISILANTGYYVLLCYNYNRGGALSTVYPIMRGTGVIGTVLLSATVFGEAVSPLAAAGMGAVCGGIAAMSLAPAGNRRLEAKSCLAALCTGLCTMTYSLADKRGAAYLNPMLYNNIINLGALLPLAGLAHPQGLAEARRQVRKYFKEALFIGFGCMGTYCLILWTLRLERASYVVSLREFSIVVAALLGFVFLKEKVSPLKLTGIAGITAGILLIKAG